MHDGKSLPTLFILAIIRVYQLVIAPLLPGSCRYVPSCSRYAQEAVLTHGALKGSWMAVRRILRCHPFGGAGFDPIPGRAGRRDTDPGSARLPAPAEGFGEASRRAQSARSLLDRCSLGESGPPGRTEHAHPND